MKQVSEDVELFAVETAVLYSKKIYTDVIVIERDILCFNDVMGSKLCLTSGKETEKQNMWDIRKVKKQIGEETS